MVGALGKEGSDQVVQRGEGPGGTSPGALGLVGPWPGVVPGPSPWAPAGSREPALPAEPACPMAVPQEQPLPGTSVVAMATTEVLTC